jgi:glycosyltransferase involved in cell wall biosynthesis
MKRPTRVDIWHNILWAKYKGEVFSSLYKIVNKEEFDVRFFQIAETHRNYAALSAVDLEHHRYPFTLLFKGAFDRVSLAARLSRILLYTIESDADLFILIGYEKLECWAQLALLKLRGKRVALFVDSTIKDKKQRAITRVLKSIIFRSVDGIFAYGLRSKEYAVYYGARPSRVFDECQAAALPAAYSPEKAFESRLKLAPRRGAPRFLYVGRLSPEKGLITLIEAFAIVRQRKNNASLIVVGSGPLQEDLAKKAEQGGIQDHVKFCGSKSGDELFIEYAEATALVLPSTSEPWGLVVNEALACGCPAIVSRQCGCVPELVIDGKTGYVHKPGSADDLSSKMLAAIEQFADTQKTARECIEVISQYTPDKVAEQILFGCRAIMTTCNR